MSLPSLAGLRPSRLAEDRGSIHQAKVERRRRAAVRESEGGGCARAELLKAVLDAVSWDLEMAKDELRKRVSAASVLEDLMTDLEKELRRSGSVG